MATQKTISIIFSLLVLIFSSRCTDSGDDFNTAGLYGSWEVVDYREDLVVNQVNSLLLNPNGSYQKSTTYREPETGSLVGYYHFQEGTFILDGETIAFKATRDLYMENNAAWGDFEELTELPTSAGTHYVISTFEFSEKGSKLAIITECNDVLLLSMCASHPVYSRVTT